MSAAVADPILGSRVREQIDGLQDPGWRSIPGTILGKPGHTVSAKDQDILEVVNALGAEQYQKKSSGRLREMISQSGARQLANLAKRLRQFGGSGPSNGGILALGVGFDPEPTLSGPQSSSELVIKILVRSEREQKLLREFRSVVSNGHTHRIVVRVEEEPRGNAAGLPIQGGYSIGNNTRSGTVGCRVADTSGRYYVLTAGHIFDGAVGSLVYHPAPPPPLNLIGPVSQVHLTNLGRLDAALIGPVTPAQASQDLFHTGTNPVGVRAPVIGETVTMFGAASLAAGAIGVGPPPSAIQGVVVDDFAFATIRFPGIGRRILVALVSIQTKIIPVGGDSGGVWVGADNMVVGIQSAVATATGYSLATKFSNTATRLGVFPA